MRRNRGRIPGGAPLGESNVYEKASSGYLDRRRNIGFDRAGVLENKNYASFDGQSLLKTVTQATGGSSYWDGRNNPVSFSPYFDDIAWRLQNQYRLSFHSPLKGKPEIESMELKIGGATAEICAPQRVFVTHPRGK
jgi:hypothetical protein